jgi:uncharacterized protein YacL
VADSNHNLHPLEAAARQRAVLVRIVRVLFLALFFTVTLLAVLKFTDAPNSPNKLDATLAESWKITVPVALLLAGVVILIDIFTPTKKISTLFSVFVGLVAAILATVALGFILDLLVKVYDIKGADNIVAAVKVLLGIALAYLGITTVLQTQDDFRLVIPYVEFAKQLRGPRPLLLDSSALIDGRIVDVGATGILQSPLVIPKFVISELQLLADSSDRSRRNKGRRGLENVQRLQRSAALDVTIDESPVPGKAVDQMLVELARTMPGVIITSDLALAKIAKIQSVGVINLNELAAAMKAPVAPGERITLRVVKPGEQPDQGVGFLDDGTMVVIEDGAQLIGQSATVQVVSMLQTAGGRIVFARARETGAADASEQTQSPDLPPAQEMPASDPETQPEDGSVDTGAAERPLEGQFEQTADQAGSPPPRTGPFPPKRPDPRRSGVRNPRR